MKVTGLDFYYNCHCHLTNLDEVMGNEGRIKPVHMCL